MSRKRKPEALALPEGKKKLLLHSCCAPCSGEIIDECVNAGFDFSVYFYNPNIHPMKEYLLRKESNIAFCKKMGVEFIDADYDAPNWFERAKGMEREPEKGRRCEMCFTMRLTQTALYAAEHGFDVIGTSLGISRWKDLDQVNACGMKAAASVPGVEYWARNWRKGGGATRMIEVAKREGFYQQEYCGCVYSLRDANEWKRKNGRPTIQIGAKRYRIADVTEQSVKAASSGPGESKGLGRAADLAPDAEAALLPKAALPKAALHEAAPIAAAPLRDARA